jgi:hypothetical protein
LSRKDATFHRGTRLGRKLKKMLNSIMVLIAAGVGFFGGVLIVFGAVSLGTALQSGSSGGGGQIASAISTIVGGAVIIAAAIFFSSLDTSWAG